MRLKWCAMASSLSHTPTLPSETPLFTVFRHLGPGDLEKVGAVSKTWRAEAISDSLWRSHCNKAFPTVEMIRGQLRPQRSFRALYWQRRNANRRLPERSVPSRADFLIAVELCDPFGACLFSTVQALPVAEEVGCPSLMLQAEDLEVAAT